MVAQIERWRRSWRTCWAPTFSDRELEVMAQLLATDDERLIQAKTVLPYPAEAQEGEKACQGCLVAATLFVAHGPMSPAAAQTRWELRLGDAIDRAPEDDRKLAWSLLHFWDGECRVVARAGLHGEVSRTLGMRGRGERDMTVVLEDPEQGPAVVVIAG